MSLIVYLVWVFGAFSLYMLWMLGLVAFVEVIVPWLALVVLIFAPLVWMVAKHERTNL